MVNLGQDFQKKHGGNINGVKRLDDEIAQPIKCNYAGIR